MMGSCYSIRLALLWTFLLTVIVMCQVASGANVHMFKADSMGGHNKTRVCYYCDRIFNASKIPADLCTHILYCTAVVTPHGVVPRNPSDVDSWKMLVKLKEKNPDLKILISLGMNFTSVVGQGPAVLQSFVAGTKKLLDDLNLDGIDLDWETPNSKQKLDFVEFQRVLSGMLKSEGKLLSAALPHFLRPISEGFSIQAINKYFDFVTVMTYDYRAYSPAAPYTGYNSPLKPAAQLIEGLIHTLRMEPSKILLGYATYARSWQLADPNNHSLGAKAIGVGAPGPYLQNPGYYALPGICIEAQKGGKIVEDLVNGAEYMYNKDTWVAFNGMFSARVEADWIRKIGIGGVGFFAIEFEDHLNICGYGPFPVLNSVKAILERP